MLCDYCGAPAKLVTGREVYPHLRRLHGLPFYRCSPCEAYVGCHPGTTRPLGRIANADLRRAKDDVHRAFEPIWQNGTMSRSEAYQWLAKQLGIEPSECHVGMFDLETCRRATAVLRAVVTVRDSGVDAYYARKDAESRAAWARYREALERGADAAELHRLREAAIDAGNTGD